MYEEKLYYVLYCDKLYLTSQSEALHTVHITSYHSAHSVVGLIFKMFKCTYITNINKYMFDECI